MCTCGASACRAEIVWKDLAVVQQAERTGQNALEALNHLAAGLEPLLDACNSTVTGDMMQALCSNSSRLHWLKLTRSHWLPHHPC